MRRRERVRDGFSLVELLVVIAVIGVLVALLLPAVQAAREAARRMSCTNNVKQIALAMHNYHDARKELPPGAISWTGDPSRGTGSWYDDHGWYTQIGAYIEETNWYNTIDFKVSFSDAKNEKPRRTMIPLYGCPSDGLKRNEFEHINWGRVRGNYVVNYGNTMYSQADKAGVKFGGAPFGNRRSSSFADIRDGLSHTLMLSECVTVGELNSQAFPNWGGPISDIATSLGGQTFETWVPPNSSVPDEAARLCPPTYALNGLPGCNLIGNDMTLQTFAARSKHPAGVVTALCDGSVRFVADDIDVQTWRGLSTSKGNEIVDSSVF